MSERDPVSEAPTVPNGLVVVEGEGLRIRRRWLRPKHFIFLAWLLPIGVWLLMKLRDEGASVPLVLGSLIVVSMLARLAAMFFNRTEIHLADARLELRHGPLPAVGVAPVELDLSAVTSFGLGRHGAMHSVTFKVGDGPEEPAVLPLATMAQAAFVRDALASALGVEAEGRSLELSHNEKFGAGALLVSLLPLAVVAFVVVMMGATMSHG